MGMKCSPRRNTTDAQQRLVCSRRPQTLALPAFQTCEIATSLGDPDLTSWEVHVRALDKPTLVGCERYPLGEHVVCVGKPGAAVRARMVGKLDAVLAEHAPRAWEVGEDRL